MNEAVPILRVVSADATVAWLRPAGYEIEWEHRFEPEGPAFVSVARYGGARLFLSEHADDASPDTLVYVLVDDIDAIAAVYGTEILEQDWAREVRVSDPDGNRFRFGMPGQPVGG
jgi:hypothetical protein